ncbi:MAG: RNA methyltransferase [Omnitrophica bacterium]|nr:RNA methyltransferase [Candidatus Omnitrophota bacterium]
MVLYGRNSICERLMVNPASIEKVFLQESFRVPHIEKLIREKNVPIERVGPRDIAKIKNAKDLQGIVARVDEFKYTPFKELLGRSPSKNTTFVFLDRINDPQNLGVIIRILACFGGFCAVIPKFEACSVTEAVLHVASGGENYVPVSMVPNLSNAIIAAKKKGYWIAGALVADAKDIDKVSLPFPLGLVLGSEGKGVRHGLQKQLDMRVHIPMNGARLSLNVNTACAILCHEISKERGPLR